MRQVSDVGGAVIHSTREYDIAQSTAVAVGQVVKLVGGKVVPADKAETGAILGYAAENHSGEENGLNPREAGKRILVQDSPNAVAACPAPVVTATGGTETTITVGGMAAFAANAFKGGYVKGGDGFVREITASAVASGVLTLTVEEGATPTSGEEIVIFPPRGFTGGNLSEDGRKLVLTATANLPLTVMGRNEKLNEIWLVATKHALASGR